MASFGVQWDGLEDLKIALHHLPDELAEEANRIITDTVNAAQREVVETYERKIKHPSGTGLATHVTHEPLAGGDGLVGYRLRSGDPLANIYEIGTQARHTRIGANRGSMPPGHVVVPIAIRHRRSMFARLLAMVRAHGLTVTGDL
jgi:hypothetical protein